VKIPKTVTIELHAVEQAALETLLSEGTEESTIEDLLNLVVTAGLMKMLIGREVPEVEGSLAAQCERLAPERMMTPGTGPSKSADFMALALDAAQVQSFDELGTAYPTLDQNQIGRIVVNLGLEAAQRDLPRGGER